MSISYIDAHCHLQLDPLWERRGEIVHDARQHRVSRVLVNSTCPGEDWSRVQQLAAEYPDFVTPSYGLHPLWIGEFASKCKKQKTGGIPKSCCSTTVKSQDERDPICLECDCLSSSKRSQLSIDETLVSDDILDLASTLEAALTRILTADSNACVGECGLDKRISSKTHDKIFVPLEFQKLLMRVQLDVASKLRRVVSVHCVGCWGSLLEVVTKSKVNNAADPNPPAIILHSSNGMSIEIASRFKTMENVYFSFSARHFSSKTKELVRSLPLNRILLETDSPDQVINYQTAHELVSTGIVCSSESVEADLRSLHCSSAIVNESKYLYFGCALLSAALEVNNEYVAEILLNNTIRALACRAQNKKEDILPTDAP